MKQALKYSKKKSFKNILFFTTLFCFVTITYAQSPALNYYRQALDAYKKNNYYQAIALLQKSLTENSYYFDAKLLLADAYFNSEDYSSAFDYYTECERMDPNNTHVLLKLAKIKMTLAHNTQTMLGARFYLEKAYKIAPRDPEVISTFGEYYYNTGDYNKAMTYYNMLGDDSSNITVHLNKAKVYEKWGQNDSVLKELKKAETLGDDNYLVMLSLGNFYNKIQDYDNALIYLSAAEKMNGNNSQVLFGLAKMYIDKKDYKNAANTINNLIKQNPQNILAYYYLGVCLQALGEFDKSINVLMQGLSYDVNNEFLRIKAEEIVVKQFPLGDPVRKTLAAYYNDKVSKLQQQGEGVTPLVSFYLNRSLRINPLSVPVRIALANFYRQQGLIYEYLSILKSGLFLAPKNQNLKDAYDLNQKFTLNTLEARDGNLALPKIPLDPVFSIDDVVIDSTDGYPYFENELKVVLLEKLLNTKSINVFIRDSDSKDKPSDYGIKLFVTPKDGKIEMKAEILNRNTKSIAKVYDFTEYGSDKLLSGLGNITKSIQKDIPVIGRIIRVDTDTAIINLGMEQGVSKGMIISIYSNQKQVGGVPIYRYNTPLWQIATGKITQIGENIAEVSFKPLDSVVYNMVQQNQIVLISKSPPKKG